VFFGNVGDRPNEEGLSRKHVVEACHDALRRLQVDYLDLYYCHRPDPSVPIEESCRAMHDLIVQGKVLYWGTSEWSASQIEAAHAVCDHLRLHHPQMEQPQYNLFHRSRVEKEYAQLYRSPGLGTTIWSPLGSGLLTGKYGKGVPKGARLNVPGLEWLREEVLKKPGVEKRVAAVPRLAAVAKGLGTSLPCMAIAWCLKNPNVSTVILGASRVEQLRENLGALDLLDRLTPPVMRELDDISAPLAE
jgi:aryl-alcohol dehydrogenase-like predicted oxidoreductase